MRTGLAALREGLRRAVIGVEGQLASRRNWCSKKPKSRRLIGVLQTHGQQQQPDAGLDAAPVKARQVLLALGHDAGRCDARRSMPEARRAASTPCKKSASLRELQLERRRHSPIRPRQARRSRPHRTVQSHLRIAPTRQNRFIRRSGANRVAHRGQPKRLRASPAACHGYVARRPKASTPLPDISHQPRQPRPAPCRSEILLLPRYGQTDASRRHPPRHYCWPPAQIRWSASPVGCHHPLSRSASWIWTMSWCWNLSPALLFVLSRALPCRFWRGPAKSSLTGAPRLG